MACAGLHNYVINQDMDLTIDPTMIATDFHNIAALQTRNRLTNEFGYLPVVEPFAQIAGTSELRAVIVDYIKARGIRRRHLNEFRMPKMRIKQS